MKRFALCLLLASCSTYDEALLEGMGGDGATSGTEGSVESGGGNRLDSSAYVDASEDHLDDRNATEAEAFDVDGHRNDADAEREAGQVDAPHATIDPVNLRSAASFALLSGSGITNVPPSAVQGNVGVSPITSTAITGLVLILDPSGTYAHSAQVVGSVFAPDYTAPTPAMLTTARADMTLAFTDATGRAPSHTEYGAGNIGGLTLAPGVYSWASALTIPTSVTLAGDATDVWILNVAQTIDVAGAARVMLSGGALAKNVFVTAGGAVSLEPGAHAEGVWITSTSCTMKTGSSLNGRLMCGTACVLQSVTILAP